MQGVLAKCAAVLIGALLLLFAVAMLMEGSGFVQSGRNNALAYVIGLLGLGLIAAAFLGDSLKYHGEGSGPLGKVIATGGAAVFVIGLIFILSSGDDPARPPEPGPTPTAQASATPDLAQPGATGTAQNGPLPQGDAGMTQVTRTDAQEAPPPAPPMQNQPDAAAIESGAHLAWTYCSVCCPEGPDTCPHTSWGVAPSAEQAAATAIFYCTGSGGTEQSCRANVQLVSEDELAL